MHEHFDLEGLIVVVAFYSRLDCVRCLDVVANVFARLGPALVIAGFFAIPLLTQ